MLFAETKALMILASHYPMIGVLTLSYNRLLERALTGYTHLYLRATANFSNLESTAKLDVVLKLAECDLLGIETF